MLTFSPFDDRKEDKPSSLIPPMHMSSAKGALLHWNPVATPDSSVVSKKRCEDAPHSKALRAKLQTTTEPKFATALECDASSRRFSLQGNHILSEITLPVLSSLNTYLERRTRIHQPGLEEMREQFQQSANETKIHQS
jgi:hypothetical protein